MKVKSIEVDTRPDHDGQWIMVRGTGQRSGKVGMLMRLPIAELLAIDLTKLCEEIRQDDVREDDEPEDEPRHHD